MSSRVQLDHGRPWPCQVDVATSSHLRCCSKTSKNKQFWVFPFSQTQSLLVASHLHWGSRKCRMDGAANSTTKAFTLPGLRISATGGKHTWAQMLPKSSEVTTMEVSTTISNCIWHKMVGFQAHSKKPSCLICLPVFFHCVPIWPQKKMYL